jgi:hypothetical protein
MITWIHQVHRSEPREGKTTFGDLWCEDNETYDYHKRGACRVSHDLDTGEYMWSVLGYVGYTKTLEKAQEKCQRILDLTFEFERQIDLIKSEKD